MSASYRLTPRDLVALILAFPLTLVHLIYAGWGGYQLLMLAGAIRGPVAWAWACPIHVPGCFVMTLGDSRTSPPPGGLPGFLLLLLGSLLAGFSLASLLAHALGPRGSRLGPRYWRLWLFLLTWGWIPVPPLLSWVYRLMAY